MGEHELVDPSLSRDWHGGLEGSGRHQRGLGRADHHDPGEEQRARDLLRLVSYESRVDIV